MRKVSFVVGLVLTLLLIMTMPTRAESPLNVKTVAPSPTDALQTIPPIIASSPTAIAGCTIMSVVPGSAIVGTSGFLRATCPGSVYHAIKLGATETPTFLLTTGWTAMSIMFADNPCSFNFLGSGSAAFLMGKNLTSGTPITFLPANQYSTTQLTTGPYDYCLFYSNPPSGGMLTFTVAWSP